MIGQKLLDGLRAFAEREGRFDLPFTDARLVELGYSPKVADSIIERLARKGWIEWGVSMRSGWLTSAGRSALRGLPAPRERDSIDQAIEATSP